MKILLVRPSASDETIGLQHVMLVEPLELEVLGALVGDDDEVSILDQLIDKKPLEYYLRRFQPDLVAVTGYITHVPQMIDICRRSKAHSRFVATVVGGVHCEVKPEHLDHPDVDFRVVRNATRVFPVLLQHLKGLAEQPAGVLRPGETLDEKTLPALDFYYPQPNRSLTARYRKQYFYIFIDHVALLKTSFGCPFKCSFCYCRTITRDRYFARPLDQVLDELQDIKEREVYIVDDDFLYSEKRLRDFIQGLRARQIDKHFLVYGRADFIAAHPELMAELRDHGLRTVIVGFESFRGEDLDKWNKHSDANANVSAMQVCNKLGIDVFATLVIPPDWRAQDFALHAKKFRELGMNYVNLQPLTPLPGTDTPYDDRDLLIAPGDFARWDLAHVALRPTHMSVAEFYRQLIKLYEVTIYQPRYLLSYLKYPKRHLAKMLLGTLRVRAQYQRKLREARALL